MYVYQTRANRVTQRFQVSDRSSLERRRSSDSGLMEKERKWGEVVSAVRWGVRWGDKGDGDGEGIGWEQPLHNELSALNNEYRILEPIV
jgi:hypothetical protein